MELELRTRLGDLGYELDKARSWLYGPAWNPANAYLHVVECQKMLSKILEEEKKDE